MTAITSRDYVELRCRSAFSFLDGASLPEDLIAAAAARDHAVLALSDRDGVYGAPRFFAEARKQGVRPIVGAEVTLAKGPPLLLLVETRRGYQNLCRLLTGIKEGRPKEPAGRRAESGRGGATIDQLAQFSQGLIALGGSAPRDDVADLRRVFGSGNFFFEVQRHFDASQVSQVRAVRDQAAAQGIPLVATNDVRYAHAQDRRVHDILTCLRERCTVDQVGRRLAMNAERWLKPPAEMASLFRDLPAAVRATRGIAERCGFSLADLGYEFPSYPVPEGETQQSYLEGLVWQGWRDRYGSKGKKLRQQARIQLLHELRVIDALNLAGYFLVVWDIIQFARGREIMVQGRGSAANSATCYVLGITAVDAVQMELLFERFLSEERVSTASNAGDRLPDIDLDLPSGDRREEVIQHLYRKYGPRGAAMTANVITYRPRMAVRDCGRALGFSEEQLNRISKHLPGWFEEDQPLSKFIAEAGFPASDGRTALLAELATALLNLPRHLGQHSGGMVIAAGRLDEVVPLEPASMAGRVVVQWDKDDCADLGLVKVDLLGLGMMAALEEAIPLIERHEGVRVDYAHLPPADPKTYEMLRAADTVGMFQVESRAQMATLPRMKPVCFYDLVVEVAIIRPGPIVGKMLNPYLARRVDPTLVKYAHPSLEPILKRTLGVPLFQEQLIRMAMEAAGFSGGQAEELRRAMGFKRSVERMNVIEKDLRAGMVRKGITGAAQEEIVLGIKSFALYGFPESHAISFALLAYASAYLKAHHPAAFLCVLLNNYPMGFYHPSTLITDAARHGVKTLAVDVMHSKARCDLEGHQTVRLGFNYVNGLRKETGARLAMERERRRFASLADLQTRVDPNPAELATLAEIGALHALGGTRRQTMWQVDALERSGRLFRGKASAEPSPLGEMTDDEEISADFRGTGVTTKPHPVTALRDRLSRAGVLSAAELAKVPHGTRARIGGVVIVRQRPATAKGFVFITLEDETGFTNAIVTPDRYNQHRSLLVSVPALIIEGVVQNQQGVVAIKADRFEALSEPVVSVGMSHDFH